MNTRDQRLYHYQYRRPRHYNPTYNSNNLFDSLNMFVRADLPTNMNRSYGRYSLPKHEQNIANRSELADYRNSRAYQNYSTVGNEQESRRQTPLLTDKDQHYLKMLEEKQAFKNTEMSNSVVMKQNPQFSYQPHPQQHHPALNYKLQDSLSRQLHDFQTIKR